MRRRLLLCTLVFLLLLFTLYFYTNYGMLESNPQNIGSFQNGITKEIPSIVVYQSPPRKPENCTRAFNACNITVPPRTKWQTVGTDPDLYIYSAYVDHRLDSSFIRILAMSKGYPVGKLFCRTWYNTSTDSFISKLKKQELWIRAWDSAKPGRYYQPFLLSCPIPSPSVSAASVVNKECQVPQNVINTTILANGKINLQNFVVCLKPLNFTEDISYRLLEWLELQLLFGADRIFVYIYNVHPKTWKVLKYYEKAGKVFIKIHGLPEDKSLQSEFSGEIKNVWQKRRYEMVVYNDCFYRHIHTHRFVVNLDLDEAIVPILHDSWSEMLKNASSTNPRLKNSASIAVRNVYFFDSFGGVNDSSIPSYMHMLRHVHRSANFTPLGFAQKSFFATNLTMSVSNHFALMVLRPGVRALSSVSKDIAHLHHYRKKCPPLMKKDCENNYMKYHKEDITLMRFKEKMIQNVRMKSKEIGLGNITQV